MDWCLWIFWISFGLAAYAYVGYPLLLLLLTILFPRPWRRDSPTGSFSFLLACRNEGDNLPRRLEELLGLIADSGLDGEIIVVSDGSTDGSAAIVRSFAEKGPVRLIELPSNQGKAVALTAGAAEARGQFLVFADARQRWAPDTLRLLLENFADPRIGAVSGDLVLETAPGVLAGVGLYWRYEKWLRKRESLLHAQVGVTGAVAACRKELFRPVPPGTLLDDVYWPLCVAMQGFRVVHDERAEAFDRLPDRPRDEFRRKVRTLAGNYQLLTRLPASLLPWRNPVWFQWLSHKLLRLVVPWALLALAATNALLVLETGCPLFTTLLALQGIGYGVGLLGLIPFVGKRVKPAGAAGSLLVLNAAAFLAFWVWIGGRAGKTWHKATYQQPGSG